MGTTLAKVGPLVSATLAKAYSEARGGLATACNGLIASDLIPVTGLREASPIIIRLRSRSLLVRRY